jgi:hypothetical protein
MLDRFVIKPSRYLFLSLLALHTLALCSIWFTDLTVLSQLGLSLLVLLSLLYHLNRHVLLRGKRSWRVFSLDKLRVDVITRGGEELAGSILDQTVVTPYLVLLRVKLEGRRMPVYQVICCDALQVDAFRELRVRLRFTQ